MSATIDRRVIAGRGTSVARLRRISTMANRPVTLPPSTLDPAAGWLFTGRTILPRRQESPFQLMADDDDDVDDDDDEDLDDDDLDDDEDDAADGLGDGEVGHGDDDDPDEDFDDDLDEDEEEDEDDLTAQKHTPTRVH
jgi:hypothetical protein